MSKKQPVSSPRWGATTKLVVALTFVAILAGFLWLQVQIDQAADGSVQIILLSISVLAEGGLLLLWHTLTSEEL